MEGSITSTSDIRDLSRNGFEQVSTFPTGGTSKIDGREGHLDSEDASEALSNGLGSRADENPSRRDVVEDDELDSLLEEALKDFERPLPPPINTIRSKVPTNSEGSSSIIGDDMNQLWSEEFIKEATAQFEKKMREYASQDQSQGPSCGNSTSIPNAAVAHDIQKVVEAAMNSSDDASLEATLNEAIKGLAMNPDVLKSSAEFGVGDFKKVLGTLGLPDEFDEKEMDDILPFMTNMMQKLLSKELLQPVLGDIVDRYPEWLTSNREKLSSSDFQKYTMQYDNMKKICEEYAKDRPEDSNAVKQRRFDYISDLMLKVQTAGPPPKDLVGETTVDGIGFPQFDPSLGGQCSII